MGALMFGTWASREQLHCLGYCQTFHAYITLRKRELENEAVRDPYDWLIIEICYMD